MNRTVSDFRVALPRRGTIYLDRATFMILNDSDQAPPDAVLLDWDEPSGKRAYRVIPTNDAAVRLLERVSPPARSPSA